MQTTERKEQVAKLTGENKCHGTNYGGSKEQIDRKVLVALVDGELREVVDARWYMGRSRDAQTVICTVWIITRDGHDRSGTGKAGGYGYCKRSAAFAAAVSHAAVWLQNDVGGRGMSVVAEAMHALADAASFADCKVRAIV